MSTVYATASRHRPPTGKYKGRHRRTWTKRTKGTVVSLAALLAATFAIGCSGAATPDAPPLDDSPAVTSPAAKVNGFTDGQYRVGSDIKPGTYTTTVRGKASDPLTSCYWARLKSFDGNLGSVNANGNLAGGAHGRVTVKASDVGVEFAGGCVWVKAK